MDNFRDSFVGQLLRLLTKRKILRYPEEIHPEHYKRAIQTDRSLTNTQSLLRWTTTRNSNTIEIEGEGATISAERHLSRPSSVRSTSGHTLNERHTSRTSRTSSARSTSGHTLNDSGATAPQNTAELNKLETQPDFDTKIVTWIDENDPANPQNWSLFKKCATTGQICFLTFSIYIGSAIYTAGVVDIEHYFHISEVAAVLGLTVFVLGYGTGPMFIAPFAEALPIGRSPVYILSVFCFIFLNFGVVYASNLGMLLAFRFLTGFVGSPVLATGGASMADIWSEKKRAYAIGVWGMFAVCGPVLGPLVGGFAAEFKGWKWPIWELIWLNAFCFTLLAFCLPETSSATILYHRAQRLRKSLDDPSLVTEAEIEAGSLSKADIAKAALWLPFKLTFREPILLVTDLYLGLVYAVLYCWFEAFPLAFIGVYHFTLGTSGLAYLGILVGAIVVVISYFTYLYLVQEKQYEAGTLTPEARLPPAIVGALCLPISLFWFGWTARESVHWIVPIIGSSFFSIGGLLLFNAILNYQGDAYPKYIGSVYAGNDLARSCMGAAFPVFAGAMFRTLGLDWGCSLLGFLSIAFIPIPIALYFFGRKIRMASKFARHDI